VTSEPLESDPVDHELQPGQGADLNDWSDRRDPAELPEPPRTGEPGVDEVLARLASVTGASLEEQLPVLESVHRTLQDRLADVDG
jgi:hypothetical protein